MAEHIIDPDFYKELYYKEIDIKYLIDEQIDDITQVIVVISGAFYFLAQHLLSKTGETSFRWIIILSIIFCAGLILRAIYYDAIASINSKISGFYKGIPTPLELLQEQKEIYNNIKREENKIEAEKIRGYVELEFDKKLVLYYSQTADHNQKVNDSRLQNTYNAKISMIYSFVAITILAIISIAS
ncbi:hypothetical protein ES702_03390 [subsurface metagenome]